MARAGSGVADGPFDVVGDGPRAQPPTASVVVSTTMSETTETAARILSVIIVSSVREPGALGALSDSAEKTAKPTHGLRCPITRQVSPLQPTHPIHIHSDPAPSADAPPHEVTELLRAWGAGDAQ